MVRSQTARVFSIATLAVWTPLALIFAFRSAAVAASPPERGYRLVRSFGPSDHQGRAQSWCVAEDARGVLYFGNLSGVLEYDGASWRLLALPNDSAVFALAPIADGRIAAGGVDELGYLAPGELGDTRYVSLTPLIPKHRRPLPDIRQIHATATGAVFQTDSDLLVWEGDRITFVPLPGPVGPGTPRSSFLVDGSVVISTDAGLFRLRGTSFEPFFAEPSPRAGFAVPLLDALVRMDAEHLLAASRDQLFAIDRSGVVTRPGSTSQASRWLSGTRVSQATTLPDGRLAVATRGRGVLILDRDLGVDEILDRHSGLQSNDVVFARSTSDGALWLVHGVGFTRVDATSPLSIFDSRAGIEGHTLDVLRHRERLYAVTSSGLFRLRPLPGDAFASGPRHRFEAVPGLPRGFSLMKDGPDVLLGAVDGVYRVSPAGHERIAGTEGLPTYAFARSREDPATVYVGFRQGLGILRREGARTAFSGVLPGTPGHVRQIVELGNVLWLGTVFSGLARVAFRDPARLTFDIRRLGAGSCSAFRVRDRLIVGTANGILVPNATQDALVPDPVLGPALGENYAFRIQEDAHGRVWLNTVPPSVLLPRGDGTYRHDRRLLVGLPGRDVQAVVAEPSGVVWFGTEEGLLRFDAGAAVPLDGGRPAPRPDTAPPLLRRVFATTANTTVVLHGGGEPTKETGPVLPFGSFRFRFEIAPGMRNFGAATLYRYALDGSTEGDSGWTPETSREYTNLSEGHYVFRARLKNQSDNESRDVVYRFEIRPPWNRTPWAYAAFTLMGIALVAGASRVRHRTLRRRNEELAERIAERTRDLAATVAELNRARADLLDRNREIAAANQRLTALSYEDGLTGIANRRHFDETLKSEWARASRLNGPIALILADIDHFKSLNDSQGHQEGDDCLRRVAATLARQVRRTSDLAARVGGEEFAILLPGTSLEGALALAEAARAEIEAQRLPHGLSPHGCVTASFGVAAKIASSVIRLEDLVAEADAALYRAKSSGRNRVMS